MGIELKDLSPAYQVKAMRQIAEQDRRRAEAREKKNKYHSQKDQRPTASGASVRFDSRKEARRYDVLMARLRAGEIKDLRLQQQFTLQEAYTTPEGARVRAIRYQADFAYLERRAGKNGDYVWISVVEDVKSRATKTRVYEIKKKLMQERYHIDSGGLVIHGISAIYLFELLGVDGVRGPGLHGGERHRCDCESTQAGQVGVR